MQATKSSYPHYFNTEENIDYIGYARQIVLWCGRIEWRGEEGIQHVVRDTSLNYWITGMF